MECVQLQVASRSLTSAHCFFEQLRFFLSTNCRFISQRKLVIPRKVMSRTEFKPAPAVLKTQLLKARHIFVALNPAKIMSVWEPRSAGLMTSSRLRVGRSLLSRLNSKCVTVAKLNFTDCSDFSERLRFAHRDSLVLLLLCAPAHPSTRQRCSLAETPD